MIKSINCSEKDIEKTLPKLKKAGFDGIDFALCDNGFMDGNWQEKAEKVKQLLDKNGMVCAQVHLPFYGIFESSEIYDEKMERNIKNSFQAMKILDTKWGAFHPQSATNYDYDRNRSMHDNIEKLKGYLEEAAKYDVGIAVENIPVFPDCPQYNFFSANVDDHIELVDALNSPLVQICWDFGHANLMKYDMAEEIKKMGDRIKILHVHNNNGMCDWHVTPTIGTIRWEGLLKTLKHIGFDGPMNLELNFKNLIPDECFDRYIKYSGEDAKLLEKKFEEC